MLVFLVGPTLNVAFSLSLSQAAWITKKGHGGLIIKRLISDSLSSPMIVLIPSNEDEWSLPKSFHSTFICRLDSHILIFLLPLLIHMQNIHFFHPFRSGFEIQHSNCWISSPDRKEWRKWLFWMCIEGNRKISICESKRYKERNSLAFLFNSYRISAFLFVKW